MNKSTPLAQLPNNNTTSMQTQNFITDQQRQYISQAQNAISNSHMPQNTQISADIMNDDDVIVQDILNQINASTDNSQQQINEQPTSQQIQQMNHQLMMQQMAQQQQQTMLTQPQNGGMFMPPQAQQAMLMSQLNNLNRDGNPYDNMISNQHPTEFKDYLLLFGDDLKLVGIVFIVVILVHFIPLDKLISRYFVIDKVPYHEIILRAIMAAILIIIIKKLVKI
jgi:hypothetical protein